MLEVDKILGEALLLEATEKLQLIEKILASIYPVSKGVDVLWNDESEERISSYANGNIPLLDEKTTFNKYKK